MGKLIGCTGCLGFTGFFILIVAVFVFMFWQFASVPGYVTEENIEAEYGDDLALIEAAINSNQSMDAELLELDDNVLEIYKQTYRRHKSGSDYSYSQQGESVAIYNKNSPIQRGYTLRNKTGIGKLEINGETIECLMIRLYEDSYLKSQNKIFQKRPKTYNEYIVYLRDTLK